MEFNTKSIDKDRLLSDLEKKEIIKDTSNQLLLSEKLNESGLVAHNILYRNVNISKDYQSERLEIIADLTKDLEFSVKITGYGVISEEFGLVETERASLFIVYKRDEKLLREYLENGNILPLYSALSKREDLVLIKDSKYIIRNKYNGYGVDEVVDSNFRKIGGISASCSSLESLFKEAKEESIRIKR